MNRRVVISCASGGGKSTLVAELGARGHAVVEEPGRRLLHHELATGGTALPWADPDAFLQRILELSIADHAASTPGPRWTFFDRSIVDAASGIQHRAGGAALAACAAHLYHATVFLAPPWPAIYVQDDERRHPFAAAEAEYHRLARDYPVLGYDLIILPRTSVAARADFILATLGLR